MTSTKLTIAVDCDDVLIETVGPIIAHYNATFGTNLILENYYTVSPPEVWGTDDVDEIGRRINSYLETSEYLALAPLKETVEVLERLRQRFDLHIVTGRPSYTQDITLSWLQKHLPDLFETVVFTGAFDTNGRSKAEVCLEIGASYLIDDHARHCSEVAAVGVKALLFGDYPWGRADTLHPNIQRVANWTEVEKVLNAAGR